MSELQNIDQLIADNKLPEALAQLDRMVEANPADGEALYRRGKVYWKLGKRGPAMSDYARSAAVDPDGKGAIALAHAQTIEDFFNPDLLNP